MALAAQSPSPYISVRRDPSRTFGAAESLRRHIIESGGIIRLKIDKDRPIEEVVEEGRNLGHALRIPLPKGGASDFAKERIENYGTALSLWQRIAFDVKWDDTLAVLRFLENEIAEDPEERLPFYKAIARTLREAVRPRSERATRQLCAFLAENGFRVREPFLARLVMLDKEYTGNATLVRYPTDKAKDKIGISEVYDKILPMLADAIAKARGIVSEVQKTDDATVVYFTKNRKYRSSLFGTKAEFRLVAAKPRVREVSDWIVLPGATYRACKKLYAQYRKDFLSPRRPIPALGKHGHTLILHYRRGAGGKVVNESYVYTVGKMMDKLKAKYGLQASLMHDDATKVILVTFYSGLDTKWRGARSNV